MQYSHLGQHPSPPTTCSHWVHPCIATCITLLNNRNMLLFPFFTQRLRCGVFQFLPILIGDLIHDEIVEHWNCFTMPWNIVQICTFPKMKKEIFHIYDFSFMNTIHCSRIYTQQHPSFQRCITWFMLLTIF